MPSVGKNNLMTADKLKKLEHAFDGINDVKRTRISLKFNF
jgi:hypothetical protein